jgi:hypothetical protein
LVEVVTPPLPVPEVVVTSSAGDGFDAARS